MLQEQASFDELLRIIREDLDNTRLEVADMLEKQSDDSDSSSSSADSGDFDDAGVHIFTFVMTICCFRRRVIKLDC